MKLQLEFCRHITALCCHFFHQNYSLERLLIVLVYVNNFDCLNKKKFDETKINCYNEALSSSFLGPADEHANFLLRAGP